MSIICEKTFTISTQAADVAAYWDFDEVAGDFIDRVKGRIITRQAWMATVAGLQGNAVQFIGHPVSFVNQFAISNPLMFFSSNPKLAMWHWVKAATSVHGFRFPGATVTIANLAAADGLNIALTFNGASAFDVQGMTGYLNTSAVSAGSGNPTPIPNDGNFHLATLSFNGTNGEFTIDGGAPILFSTAGHVPDIDWPRDITFDTMVFGPGDQVDPFEYDELGILTGQNLSAADVAFLYNGGAGRDWLSTKAHFGL